MNEKGHGRTGPVGAISLHRGDGTITDTQTNLMWQQEDDGERRMFAESETYCQAMSLGGFRDWRLPTIEEMQRIATEWSDVFVHSKADEPYWSCTLPPKPPGIPLGVAKVMFSHGETNQYFITNRYYTRAVRDCRTYGTSYTAPAHAMSVNDDVRSTEMVTIHCESCGQTFTGSAPDDMCPLCHGATEKHPEIVLPASREEVLPGRTKHVPPKPRSRAMLRWLGLTVCLLATSGWVFSILGNTNFYYNTWGLGVALIKGGCRLSIGLVDDSGWSTYSSVERRQMWLPNVRVLDEGIIIDITFSLLIIVGLAALWVAYRGGKPKSRDVVVADSR